MVPFLGLELGYPDPTEAAGVKPRLPQHVVVHRDALTASERWRLREVFEDSGLTLR